MEDVIHGEEERQREKRKGFRSINLAISLLTDLLKRGVRRKLNHLKTEFLPNNIYKSCSYLIGTYYVSTTKTNRLMLFGETVAVCCENRTEHTNTKYGQNAEF
jgi:hypothetical protein